MEKGGSGQVGERLCERVCMSGWREADEVDARIREKRENMCRWKRGW